MNGRQFILGHSAFRLMPFLRLRLRFRLASTVSFTLRFLRAIDLGLKVRLSASLAP